MSFEPPGKCWATTSTRKGSNVKRHPITILTSQCAVWTHRKVLGDHIDQKGSIVMPDKLRFDFSNNGVIEADKLAAVEQIVRDSVAARQTVSSKEVGPFKSHECPGPALYKKVGSVSSYECPGRRSPPRR